VRSTSGGANRQAAPSLVVDEFERCVTLLENSPDIGTTFHRTNVPGVRRLLMKKTKHLIYYVHDDNNAVVYIVAISSGPALTTVSYVESREGSRRTSERSVNATSRAPEIRACCSRRST
jgi:plasmid stabilization system protein ParE